MSKQYELPKEGSTFKQEKRNAIPQGTPGGSGGDLDKRKSLNLAISHYFKQKDRNEESDKFQLSLYSPVVKEPAIRSLKDEEPSLSQFNHENIILAKLYEIMRRVKLKSFALQLLNSTPSRMFKSMKAHQFSLINDRSQDFSNSYQDLSKNNQSYNLCFFLTNLLSFLSTNKACVPIFNPSNKYKLLWDINFALVLFYSLFTIPIIICFGDSQSVPDQKILPILFAETVIDVIITCNTGFYKRGVLCKERRKIWRKYVKEQFCVDAICLISILANSYFLNSYSLYREYPFVLIFSLFKRGKLSHLYNELEYNYLLRPKIRNILSLLNLFFKVLLIAHSCACVWIIVGRISISLNPSKSWIVAQKLQDSIWEEQYLTAIYFCIVTMTTVGYGDVVPISTIEIITSSMIMLLSAGLFGFIVNTISDILQDFSKSQRIIMEKMFIIKKYLMKNSISPELSNDITEYLETTQRFVRLINSSYFAKHPEQCGTIYNLESKEDLIQLKVIYFTSSIILIYFSLLLRYYWSQNIDYSSSEGEKMVSILSDELRNDLLVESNKIVLKNCQLFQNNFSEELTKAMVSIIQAKNYAPSQIIYQKGESVKNPSIYFVQAGAVESFMETTNFFEKSKSRQQTIEKFKQGEYFGELEFFTDEDQIESIKSLKFTKLLKIDRSDFINLLKKYPEDYEQFCYIKDRLTTKHDLQKLYKTCFSCKSQNHSLNKCPYVNYIPNKPKIIAQYNREETPLSENNLDISVCRTMKKQNQFNMEELKFITEDFQALHEEKLQEYEKEYLSFDISKCDICASLYSQNNLLSNPQLQDIFSPQNQQQQQLHQQVQQQQQQLTQQQHQQSHFNHINNNVSQQNQIPVSFDKYNSSKFSAVSSNSHKEDQITLQKMNQHKKAFIKSVRKTTNITSDDFEAFDLLSQCRPNKATAISNIKSRQDKPEIKLFNNQQQFTISSESHHKLIKSHSVILDQDISQQEKSFPQQNLGDSQLIIPKPSKTEYQTKNSQSEQPEKQMINYQNKEQQQHEVMNVQNFNTSLFNPPISPLLPPKISYQVIHTRIVFFDLFQGQFEKMHSYQFYYPLGNSAFILQQLSLDIAQQKKLKNKLMNTHRIALQKLVQKANANKRMSIEMSSNFHTIKKILDKNEIEGRESFLKSQKGYSLQSLNANSHNQLANSPSDSKVKMLKELVNQITDNKSNRSMIRIEESEIGTSYRVQNCVEIPEKDGFQNRSGNQSFNFLKAEGADEMQSFRGPNNNNNNTSKSKINAFKKNPQQAATNDDSIKPRGFGIFKNNASFITTNFEDQEDCSELQKRNEEMSPPLKENKVSFQNHLEICNNINLYFDKINKDERFQEI